MLSQAIFYLLCQQGQLFLDVLLTIEQFGIGPLLPDRLTDAIGFDRTIADATHFPVEIKTKAAKLINQGHF